MLVFTFYLRNAYPNITLYPYGDATITEVRLDGHRISESDPDGYHLVRGPGVVVEIAIRPGRVKDVRLQLHHPVKSPRPKLPLPVRHMVAVIRDGDLFRAWYRGGDKSLSKDAALSEGVEVVHYAESDDRGRTNLRPFATPQPAFASALATSTNRDRTIFFCPADGQPTAHNSFCRAGGR